MSVSDKAREKDEGLAEIQLQQSRSVARRELLLDTAAALIAENGAKGFALRDVRKAAGVSQGSLYQYFPSKDDLISALHERFANEALERLGRVAEALAAASEGEDLAATLVDAIIDQFAPFYAKHPAYRELRLTGGPVVEDGENTLDRIVVQRTAAMLQRLYPDQSDGILQIRATALLNMTDALLFDADTPVWREEARIALSAYLKAH